MESRKIISIFLASPGDLGPERRLAKQVCDKFNRTFASTFGYQVELFGWEDTVSVFARPQDAINPEVDKCELFVGMVWKHWGTPPGGQSGYQSGFEEEYERAVARRERGERIEISILLKNVADSRDPGPQLSKVLAFHQKLKDEQKILYEGFEDEREFILKFDRCISNFVVGLYKQDRDASSAPSEESPLLLPPARTQVAGTPGQSAIVAEEEISFATSLLERAGVTESIADVSAVDIARFRLLASRLKTQQNDEERIGVHDANILYDHRGSLGLTRRERRTLLAAGCSYFSQENAPVWFWTQSFDGERDEELSFLSLSPATSTTAAGAILMMRLIGTAPTFFSLQRRELLEIWLSSENSSVRTAALAYLELNGTLADIELLEAEYNKNDYGTRSQAVEALVSIRLRESAAAAIETMCKYDNVAPSASVLRRVFESHTRLDIDALLRGLEHRSASVRLRVIHALRQDHLFSPELAEKLLLDVDADVRLQAMKRLVEGGRTFDADEAKRLLKAQNATQSGFGILNSLDSGTEAREREFNRVVWTHLPVERLQALAQDKSFPNEPVLHFYRARAFEQEKHTVRRDVSDRSERAWSEYMEVIRQLVGEEHDLFRKTYSLERFVRDRATALSIETLCERGDVTDLELIRAALNRQDPFFSAPVLRYLGRAGDMGDLPLVGKIATGTVDSRERGLLSLTEPGQYVEAAKAALQICKNDLSKIIGAEFSPELLKEVLRQAHEASIRALDDEHWLALFGNENDAVRKIAALRMVIGVTKRRVAHILSTYNGGSYRYYNVVFWGDLLLSFKVTEARRIARTVLVYLD